MNTHALRDAGARSCRRVPVRFLVVSYPRLAWDRIDVPESTP